MTPPPLPKYPHYARSAVKITKNYLGTPIVPQTETKYTQRYKYDPTIGESGGNKKARTPTITEAMKYRGRIKDRGKNPQAMA